MIFEYGDAEIQYLSSRDKILGEFINKAGKIEREIQPDLFTGFCLQLICQQISMKAALTVFERLKLKLGGEISPKALISCDSLAGVGISARKADNLLFAAKAIVNNEISRDKISAMTQEEAIKALCEFPGVGVWTAEMLLLFTFESKDVLSYGDFGIKSGMKKLYGYNEITPDTFKKLKQTYSPCGSVASLYLWEASKL